MRSVVVHKGRTEVLAVSLSYDVSQDVLTSHIRVSPSRTSQLIAEWTVSFDTDGTDGKLLLTLDDSVTTNINASSGYMDIKRMVNGEPIHVFENPIPVSFVEVVTP